MDSSFEKQVLHLASHEMKTVISVIFLGAAKFISHDQLSAVFLLLNILLARQIVYSKLTCKNIQNP